MFGIGKKFIPEGAFSPISYSEGANNIESQNNVFEKALEDKEVRACFEKLTALHQDYIKSRAELNSLAGQEKYLDEKTGGWKDRLRMSFIPEEVASILDNFSKIIGGSITYNNVDSFIGKKDDAQELKETRKNLSELEKHISPLEEELTKKSLELQNILQAKGMWDKLRAIEEVRLRAHIEEKGL